MAKQMGKERIKRLAKQNKFGYGQYKDMMYNKDHLLGEAKRARAEAKRLEEYAKQCDYLREACTDVSFIGKVPIYRKGNIARQTTFCLWDGRETIRTALISNSDQFKVEGKLKDEVEFSVLLESGPKKIANEVVEKFLRQSECPPEVVEVAIRNNINGSRRRTDADSNAE